MMKVRFLSILTIYLISSYNAFGQQWKRECVSYYQIELPREVETALYPVEDFLVPRKQPESDGAIKTRLYASPKITFGRNSYIQDVDSLQAQFTNFYYDNYKLGISSHSHIPIDWLAYRKRVAADKDFYINVARRYEERNSKLFNESLMPDLEFKRKNDYIVKDYPDSFGLYTNKAYALYVLKDNRIYHFWKKNQKDSGDKSQTAESQVQKSESEVLSLLNRFRSRKLYEIPSEQGFCLPYGFISGDSGHEQRNMGVTWRLKEHPDVTIFFQDLGPDPGPGESRPDPNMSAKDFVTDFWNVRYGHSFRDIKLYGRGFSYPEIDKREAVAAFAKFTRFSKEVDYGYVAFVKGTIPEEPDLLFYVMRDSRQAKGRQPMDKDELEKMAEHIVSSIKKR